MNQATKVFVGMLVIAGVLVVGFFVVGPAGPPVYASPQDVFAASKKASVSRDLVAWCQCLTDESRDVFVAIEIIGFVGEKMKFEKAIGGDGKSLFRDLDVALNKHGLTPQFLARVASEAAILRDQRATAEEKTAFYLAVVSPARNSATLLADAYRAMGKITNQELPKIVEIWQDASISDLKVTGNTAVGILAVEGGGSGPIHFRNQGEGWRIELKQEESRPRMPPGHPPMPR